MPSKLTLSAIEKHVSAKKASYDKKTQKAQGKQPKKTPVAPPKDVFVPPCPRK